MSMLLRRGIRLKRVMWPLATVVIVVIAAVLLKGCTTTVVAPAQVEDPVAVYILDYGRHPGLVLPRSEHELVEYAYGEWDWFAMNRTGWAGIFRALFINTEATLGRRPIHKEDGADWWEDIHVSNLHPLIVERRDAESLLAELDQQWESQQDTAVYNRLNELEHVRHDEPYHGFNNSNIVMGRWLEALNCTVRGWPLYPVNWRVVTE